MVIERAPFLGAVLWLETFLVLGTIAARLSTCIYVAVQGLVGVEG